MAPFIPHNNGSDDAASVQDEGGAEVFSPYKDRPWDYFTSEGTPMILYYHCKVESCIYSILFYPWTEYIERYGAMPVWTGYRRNHKGGIPPQKTRKTCIVNDLSTICCVLPAANLTATQFIFCREGTRYVGIPVQFVGIRT